MLGMLIVEKGCLLYGIVYIGDVDQGVTELLQAVYWYTKLKCICCGVSEVLKLNFGFPNLG